MVAADEDAPTADIISFSTSYKQEQKEKQITQAQVKTCVSIKATLENNNLPTYSLLLQLTLLNGKP